MSESSCKICFNEMNGEDVETNSDLQTFIVFAWSKWAWVYRVIPPGINVRNYKNKKGKVRKRMNNMKESTRFGRRANNFKTQCFLWHLILSQYALVAGTPPTAPLPPKKAPETSELMDHCGHVHAPWLTDRALDKWNILIERSF